jgi:hypothetical protein
LLVDGGDDGAGLPIETHVGRIVADLPMVCRTTSGMSTQEEVVISPAIMAMPVVTEVSQATRAFLILLENGIKDGIGNLIGNLVGVTFSHRF